MCDRLELVFWDLANGRRHVDTRRRAQKVDGREGRHMPVVKLRAVLVFSRVSCSSRRHFVNKNPDDSDRGRMTLGVGGLCIHTLDWGSRLFQDAVMSERRVRVQRPPKGGQRWPKGGSKANRSIPTLVTSQKQTHRSRSRKSQRHATSPGRVFLVSWFRVSDCLGGSEAKGGGR